MIIYIQNYKSCIYIFFLLNEILMLNLFSLRFYLFVHPPIVLNTLNITQYYGTVHSFVNSHKAIKTKHEGGIMEQQFATPKCHRQDDNSLTTQQYVITFSCQTSRCFETRSN